MSPSASPLQCCVCHHTQEDPILEKKKDPISKKQTNKQTYFSIRHFVCDLGPILSVPANSRSLLVLSANGAQAQVGEGLPL